MFHLGFDFNFGGDLKPSLLDESLSLEKKDKFWVIKDSTGALVLFDHLFNTFIPGNSSCSVISNQLSSFDSSLTSQTSPSETFGATEIITSSPVLSSSLNNSAVLYTSSNSTVLDNSQVGLENENDEDGKKLSKKDQDMLDKLIEKDGNRYFRVVHRSLFNITLLFSLESFKCKLCSFVSILRGVCYDHIQDEHKDWKIQTGLILPCVHISHY